MKKFVAIFLLIFATYSLIALEFRVGADLRSFDSIFRDGVRIDGEVALKVKNIRIIVPVRYGKSKIYDLSLIETGLLVDVRPWSDLGIFAEVSLFKVGFMWGIYAPSDKVFFSSEGSLGWEFVFGPVYIRPKYTVRAVFSGEETKEERVKAIPQFGESRISVCIGVLFGGKNEKENSMQ